MEVKGCPSFTIFFFLYLDYLGLNLVLKFVFAIWLNTGILGKLDVWCFIYSFIFLLAHQSFDLVGSLTLLQNFIKKKMTLLLLNDLVAHLYEFIISLYHMGVGFLGCSKNNHIL
jgi:hypothetical protein